MDGVATGGLNILPKSVTLTPPEGEFVYDDRLFRVSYRDDTPKLPQELVNRYCEFIAKPLVEMINGNNESVLCYRDYASDNSDDPEY